MHSVLTQPELARRSFAVFSFGKTLHATGMRVGYCVAPPALTARAAQGAPVQHLQHRKSARRHAIARYLAEKPRVLARAAGFFQAKRDRLRGALARSGLQLPPAPGHLFPAAGFQRLRPAG